VSATALAKTTFTKTEDFRHQSYIAKAALGQIAGFGLNSYILALDALFAHLNQT
ncbi:MAG: type II 3-dehydroquinate dehydratase, partial [Pseudomonadota bacterium]